MSQISISELSQAISELIDLDADQQSLMTVAIDARQIIGGAMSVSPNHSWSRGFAENSRSLSEQQSAGSPSAGSAAGSPSAATSNNVYTFKLMTAAAKNALSASSISRRG